MDFEFAFWQTINLFISPQKVYRNFQYRKQSKSQFARDDPAFLVLLGVWICITSIGFKFVLDLHFVGFVKFLLYTLFVDCIAVSVVVASVSWFVLNRYFRKPQCLNEDVEWGYTFDVHLNAYFPSLILLHLVQLFFYHIFISQDWFLSRVFGNLLWVISIGYYVYITFLGYSSVPILQNVKVILYFLPVLILLYLLSLAIGFNVTVALMNFYVNRVI
ncbi:protein unc-50 homolog isoform X2 [Artemia franciscana]|uniref:protein unc-50 homolog isoform X2 n=1 Tax=Artemia franciscana TaxID=6661 RepID=UPI0032DB4202